MFEIIFLFSLAIIWMIFGAVADLKYHIVPNWLNFSLIIFALGARFFYSLFSGDFNFFYQGLIGLGIFQVLHLFNTPHFMARVGAFLLIALGILHLPTVLFPNFPIRIRLPQSLHQKMANTKDRLLLKTYNVVIIERKAMKVDKK